MGYSTELSEQLFNTLKKMGYEEAFCKVIAGQLCTEWTARRMLGYLRQVSHLKEEDIVDEMLAILSDRERITQKKEMEYYQGKINEIYNSDMFGISYN